MSDLDKSIVFIGQGFGKYMKNNVAVVIPYYHSELTALEKISFENCLAVLREYPIILVVPERMSQAEYPKKEKLIYEQVPNEWLESVASYNQMMVSKEFYKRFLQYEFILIFQLDAFVFSDCLKKFCCYDYIGAPWLNGMKYLKTIEESGIWKVGNGGLSLRRVTAFLDLFEKENIGYININEDVFWASHASEQFQVAPIDVALQFSFERDVRTCFRLNNNQLPFGCHAWERYDFEFWAPIFEQMGFKVTVPIPKGEDNRGKNIAIKEHYLGSSCMRVQHALNKLARNRKVCIYVFGAGMMGSECLWFLKHNGVDNIRCVDNDPQKWGTCIWETIIESPETISQIDNIDNLLVVIAVINAKHQILHQLEIHGYKYKYHVVFYSDLVEILQND